MRLPSPAWRARLGKGAFALLLVVVAVLLVRYARDTDWAAVAQTLRDYSAPELFGAAGLVAASYALYAGYELVSRRQTGHDLPALRTAAIGVVSYAVSLNLGALLGGGGARLRLYTRNGIGAAMVARIAGFAVITNWLGYAALAGLLLLSGRVPLPPGAGPPLAWRALGAVLVLLAAAYLLLCWRRGGGTLRVRGHAFELPRLRMAALQLLLSTANWSLLGTLMWLLLPPETGYLRVLGVVLVAAVVGVVLHTPAGLGAWESAFLLTLGRELGQPTVIAALLAYRGLYYLLPLAVALPVYLVLEARRRPGSVEAPRKERKPTHAH